MQQIVFTGKHVVLRVLVHHLGAGLERLGHQSRHVLAQLAQFVLDAGLDRVECHPGEVLIQEIGGFDKFRGLVCAIGEDNAILNITVGGDDDQQDALFRQAQELHVSERGAPALGRHYHAGEAGEIGKQVRGL